MLKIKKISCGYSSKFILNDISFALNKGEILGVIGPNGSGKTTLLKAISKILPLMTGNINFKGKDLNAIMLNDFAKQVAVVRQHISVPFNITVEEFVALGRLPHQGSLQFFENDLDNKIIDRCLELTQISDFRKRPLSKLSGGERQMAVIAKALAQEPKLLLLDEPTNFLDISHQVKILDLIRRLNHEEGLSVLIVLHDLNLASEYCNRLLLLDNGKQHKCAAVEEVLNKKTLEDVYKTPVIVKKHPLSNKPYVLIVSENVYSKES